MNAGPSRRQRPAHHLERRLVTRLQRCQRRPQRRALPGRRRRRFRQHHAHRQAHVATARRAAGAARIPLVNAAHLDAVDAFQLAQRHARRQARTAAAPGLGFVEAIAEPPLVFGVEARHFSRGAPALARAATETARRLTPTRRSDEKIRRSDRRSPRLCAIFCQRAAGALRDLVNQQPLAERAQLYAGRLVVGRRGHQLGAGVAHAQLDRGHFTGRGQRHAPARFRRLGSGPQVQRRHAEHSIRPGPLVYPRPTRIKLARSHQRSSARRRNRGTCENVSSASRMAASAPLLSRCSRRAIASSTRPSTDDLLMAT